MVLTSLLDLVTDITEFNIAGRDDCDTIAGSCGNFAADQARYLATFNELVEVHVG
jgi:hypothetical protein